MDDKENRFDVDELTFDPREGIPVREIRRDEVRRSFSLVKVLPRKHIERSRK